MKLSVSKYSAILFIQYGLLIADLVLNCIALFPRSHSAILIMFLLQDFLLILAMTAMLVNFFSTYLFQAGLIQCLFEKFKFLIVLILVYWCSCVGCHTYWLLIKWNNPMQPVTPPLALAFVLQRIIAPCYYHLYKKAALRVSDPRFYEDIDWMNNQLTQRN
ncbi:transmembrane protein 138 [Arctopsyche grandis]|uniref:transmembrane protein 138 n=1 Tax=Arctopsyche grandis TaxID=121162 RepID=UPI00406D67BA